MKCIRVIRNKIILENFYDKNRDSKNNNEGIEDNRYIVTLSTPLWVSCLKFYYLEYYIE